MYFNIACYLEDLREIEAIFESCDLKEGELDTEWIEDTLSDWEQFIAMLRDEGDHMLANQVYEKIEEIEERLREYESEKIKTEEQAVIDEAETRLSQSALENFIDHTVKHKNLPLDIGREHKAEFRLRSRDKELTERLKRLEEDA